VTIGAKPTEQIFRTPPFLAIEILSKKDRKRDILERVADYLAFLSLYAAANSAADINHDGQINVTDYLAFLSLYAAGC